MLNLSKPWLVIPLMVLPSLPAMAQQLPIPDGAYVRKASFCEDLRRGELDFIDFEVSEGGRAIGYPEAGCVVASVEPVREGRSFVIADCDEFGEIWESSFFLDVKSAGEIAIDGVPHRLCRISDAVGDENGWSAFLSQPTEMLCWFKTVRATDYWWNVDGFGHNDLKPFSPLEAGVEVPVYRYGDDEIITGPNGIRLVAEFKGYFVPFGDIEFTGRCGPSR